MPAGIQATVESGFATLVFLDSSLKGPALGKLLAIGGPELIDKSTRGTRPSYTVPENIAREAGLLDDDLRTDHEREADDQGVPLGIAAEEPATDQPAEAGPTIGAVEVPAPAVKRPARKAAAKAPAKSADWV